MEFERAELFNIVSLAAREREGDYRICRIPESVRENLNPKAQTNMMFASNCELRFVMEGDSVEICLRRMPVRGVIRPVGMMEVFEGDYQGSYEISPWAVGVEDTVITIQRQDWRHIDSFSRTRKEFSSKVTRILLPYDWGVCVKSIKGEIRPPKPEELPGKRLLCYGSSITHGGNASVPSQTYAFQLAGKLGCDCINLGSAGSAYMDRVMAEYIAERTDWDMALFELGVNVIEEWTANQLYGNAFEWITTIQTAHPDKPVIITDMYYNHYDFEEDIRAPQFRKCIKDCTEVLQKQFNRLYYIDGRQVMGALQGLSSDGLHPSDAGHTMIAEGLYKFIIDEVL